MKMYRLIAFLAVIFIPFMAKAQFNIADKLGVQRPSIIQLTDILLAQNLLDINNPNILDDVALIRECDLWTNFKNDEFRLRDLRAALKKSLSPSMIKQPDILTWTFPARLANYDFISKEYKLVGNMVPVDIDQFTLDGGRESICSGNTPKIIPLVFHLRLNEKFTMNRISLPEAEAKNFLDKLESINGKNARNIYVKLKLKIGRAELVTDDSKPANSTSGGITRLGKNLAAAALINVQIIERTIFAEPDLQSELLRINR